MKKRYLVFVKKLYVRDAQAYTSHTPIADDFYDDDDNWNDIHGDMLVMDRYAENIQVIKDQLQQLYPNVDSSIFTIYEAHLVEK